MRALSAFLVAVPLLVAAGAPARAQAAPAAAPQAVASQAKAPPAGPGGEGYSYNPQGRRDPFVSLIARGAGNKTVQGGRRPDGLAGLAVAELSVRGVMQSRNGYIAIVQGPDNKTYIARPTDRLLDGTIKAITGEGLVILQEVNDPFSLVKQKEVRKGLRASDEGK